MLAGQKDVTGDEDIVSTSLFFYLNGDDFNFVTHNNV